MSPMDEVEDLDGWLGVFRAGGSAPIRDGGPWPLSESVRRAVVEIERLRGLVQKLRDDNGRLLRYLRTRGRESEDG